MNRSFFALFLLFFSALDLVADNFRTPSALIDLSSSSIYSITQDQKGAIWLNTNKGLCRFNGISVEWLSRPMLGIPAVYDGADAIYAATSMYLTKFDLKTRNSSNIVVTSDRLNNAVLESSGDSLYIGLKDKIYLQASDSTFLCYSFADSVYITTLLHLPDSSILAGTESSGLLLCRNGRFSTVYHTSDVICSLYSDRSGKVWAGFLNDGLLCIDPKTGIVERSCRSCNGIPFRSVRSISSDSRSNVYFATVKGLFKLSLDGSVAEMTFDGAKGYPFRCVYVDRDDNVWAGSYYNGVYYSNNYSYPFTDLPFGSNVRLSKGLIRDKSGTLWLFTDNFGAYRSFDGAVSWHPIPGTGDIKYQNAYYDEFRNEIWTSEYQGDVLRYSIPSMSCKRYKVAVQDKPLEYFGPIVKRGREYFLGGINGVYIFNPDIERTVSRRIEGLYSRVFDLEFGPDGRLWIASNGLFSWSDGEKIQRYSPDSWSGWTSNMLIPDIAFDESGRLWAACVGRGVVVVDAGKTINLNQGNSGISNNHLSIIEPLEGSLALVGTSNGISIVDTDKMTSYNYNTSNGLSLSSGRWACSCRLPDGVILFGGIDGVEKMNPSDFKPLGEMPVPYIDRLDVNGKKFMCDFSLDKAIELSYIESNFKFSLTSFDYSNVAALTWHYMLEGYDEDWVPMGPSREAQYMNMAPGRYVFRVRAQRGGGPDSYASVRVVIHPAWYATVLARTGFSLLVLAIAGLLLYFLYSRTILSERLALRERENEEKTKFFVDISYQLRTPLNLIIGELETFFKNFGARTAGIADIEDVYGKAKMMRSLISDYVDDQNDAMERETTDPAVAAAAGDAKFLNAAIGAVERNLYSGKLDVSVLCREMNVGKTTLTARLRKVSGLTPREFIEDIRLKHAAKMLQDGAMRVSEVSDRLGFSSPRYFSLCFKKKYGCIPSIYAKTGDYSLKSGK